MTARARAPFRLRGGPHPDSNRIEVLWFFLSRKNRLSCLLAAALLPLAAAPAFALTNATEVTVVAHCGDNDGTVTIDSDPGLHGAMVVSGDVGRIDPPAGGHGNATVELACTSDAALSLTVPRDPGFRVAIDAIGATEWHLGELAGPLGAELRGSGDLQARALTGGMDVSAYASSDVKIERVAGDAAFHGRGSGDLTIGDLRAEKFLTDTMGSGDVAVKSGHVGALNVQTRGSGDVTLGADADTADLSTFGSGDIHVARVAGQVTQFHAGSGDITWGGRAGAGAKSGDHVDINWDQSGGHDVVITDGAGHAGHIPGAVAATFGSIFGVVFHLVLLALLVGVVVAIVRVVRRHRAGLPTVRRAASGRVSDPRVAELAVLLARVAERASRLESCITSKEFELHRGFRELGD